MLAPVPAAEVMVEKLLCLVELESSHEAVVHTSKVEVV
jgi:hypothetical protein